MFVNGSNFWSEIGVCSLHTSSKHINLFKIQHKKIKNNSHTHTHTHTHIHHVLRWNGKEIIWICCFYCFCYCCVMNNWNICAMSWEWDGHTCNYNSKQRRLVAYSGDRSNFVAAANANVATIQVPARLHILFWVTWRVIFKALYISEASVSVWLLDYLVLLEYNVVVSFTY
jgi:hypothetical protein